MNHLNYSNNNENICMNNHLIINQKLDENSDIKPVKTMSQKQYSCDDYQQQTGLIHQNQEFNYLNKANHFQTYSEQLIQQPIRNLNMFEINTDSNHMPNQSYNYALFNNNSNTNMVYPFNSMTSTYQQAYPTSYQQNNFKNETFNLQLSESPSSLSSSSSVSSSSLNTDYVCVSKQMFSKVNDSTMPYLDQNQQHNSYSHFNESSMIDLNKHIQQQQPAHRTSSSSSISSLSAQSFTKQLQTNVSISINQTVVSDIKPKMSTTLNETSVLEETNENSSPGSGSAKPVIYAWMKKVHLNNSSKFSCQNIVCVIRFFVVVLFDMFRLNKN